jgi:MscS family membrane protein
MEAGWLERVMPRALVDSRLLGITLAQWIAWAASIGVPFLLFWLLSSVVGAGAGRVIANPLKHRLFDSWRTGLHWPIVVVATMAVHLGVMRLLGFSLRFRFLYARVALAGSVLAMTWLLWRVSALSLEHAAIRAQRRGEASLRSLLMLIERVVKAFIVMVALFSLLTIAGVNTTTALAGVGLGGVAVALGAQKSVENLLGGVFLLTDKVLAVGDTCCIANRVGTVEDITLRSIRLRTQEQTLLSVPAGILSQESIENFATRGKMLIQTSLRLRYGTSADQVQSVLDGIRVLLREDPELESSTSRVQLVAFSLYAIELEVFAYVLTADFARFLSVREHLLLRIAAIVESAGSAFAQPMPPVARQAAGPASVITS